MSTEWLEQEYRRRDDQGVSEISLQIRFGHRRAVTRIIQRMLVAADHLDWLTPRDRLYVGVALEEALLNAVIHGNLEVSSALREADDDSFERLVEKRQAEGHYSSRLVTVQMDCNRSCMRVQVEDEGPGFDVARLPDPRSPDRMDLQSGRGVLMMRSFMDHVEYSGRGNKVSLVKRRPQSHHVLLEAIDSVRREQAGEFAHQADS
jgi:anti-sigma regulatory factor (Ser/Thr protein kinase)